MSSAVRRRPAVALRLAVGLAATLLAPALLAPAAGAAVAHAAPVYAQGNPWRHGVVPLRGQQSTTATQPIHGTSTTNLLYGGGLDGVGVTTGAPRVYLVFWGSQWGTQGTNASGDATFSGDPTAMAPDLQGFFKGLGTNNDTWSGVMTQYCQGVSVGAQTCPASNTQHVGYPTGGALAGVWEDTSAPAPQEASAHQIAQEAVNAATHFGNTTQSSNRDTQYFIVSPTGTYPDGFDTVSGNFCAWHDYTADGTMDGGGAVSSPDGILAFTNMPYVPDAGYSCGSNFVNSGSSGTLDGVTIVGGHEYAETITDQYPAGGWLDNQGYEAGDKCAWISPGTAGGAQDLTLATGSFPVQSIWGNDGSGGQGACEISHAIVTDPSASNTVTLTNPGTQSSVVNRAASLQISASDSGGATLSYAASGLPTGLAINSSSGLISGTPSKAGSYSVRVTATDVTGASASASFTWTVSSSTTCTAGQLLGNPGFETGSAPPWSATSGVVRASTTAEPAHSGSYLAVLDGYSTAQTDTLAQTVSVPSGCKTYAFSFWLHINTTERRYGSYDTLNVEVRSSSGALLSTLGTFSNLNASGGYVQKSYSLSSDAGKQVTIEFVGTETNRGGGTTYFSIDDTALNLS